MKITVMAHRVRKVQSNMSTITLQSQLSDQLYSIVQAYTNNLAQYSAPVSEIDPYLAPIFTWMEHITEGLKVCPDSCDQETYEQTADAFDHLVHFLHLMNQRLDDTFYASPLGKLYSVTAEWCAAAASYRALEQLDNVWEWIAPGISETVDAMSSTEDETKPSRPTDFPQQNFVAWKDVRR